MWLQTAAGTWVQVTAVAKQNRKQQVHNLTVDGVHTYYVQAGDAAVLVHNTTCPTAAQLRNSPGVATGGTNAPAAASNWLRGSHGNAGRIPGQIANQLRGRSFASFDDFRQAFWRAVGNDADLGGGFSPTNVARMRSGNAPIAVASQHYGGSGSYVLHHSQPIQHGGGVYDMDNIVVATPLYHSQVLWPPYHYGSG
jgi:hypothetical protein